ncbi:sensor c-di-GMP phosphodiesterase, contains CSS-motif sensor and EAL domain [Pseudomonas helmanticensis]|uniref:Sensor c-di-GMP phosphodiesterase, contains CSS-motif sensor and EAL domain n=1 Tax=Pseudomonas helmanticensis TaxID=1471381 RepID=A0ACD2U0Z0_9PSED|nr:sensor c-di-GMP phosphodiesterase, contains CSS-motif sensor and EAL domain [Pseudomonas helmanticensis]
MNKKRIVWGSILLGLPCVLLPVLLMGYVAWMLNLASAQQRLETLAAVASSRANGTFQEAAGALKSIAGSHLAPCTPASIDEMRLLTINTFSVKSVGYVEEEVYACGSWGPVGQHAAPWREDFTTSDGVRVSLGVQSRIVPAKPMMALQYAAFNVLVDPEQFLHVMLEDDLHLAVGTAAGQLVSVSRPGAEHFLSRVHSGSHSALEDGYLYTLVHSGDWVAIAALSRHELMQGLLRREMLLLPIGGLFAGMLVLMIVRRTRQRLSPLAELKLAVRNREFVVHYQPIVSLDDGAWVGAEALVRWQHPDGSLVRPDTFIPLAEHSGLILPITDQVIDSVMRDLGPLLVKDRSLHVAINLAAKDVSSGRFLPKLEAALRQANVQQKQIWLEATERGFVEIDSARTTVNHARALGYLAAIDDFGTGFSSLQHLQQLPLDVLKIDKSFVDNIDQDAATGSVTSHIIEMAKSLRLQIVAEGIETEAQADYLRGRGVHFGQGWLFGKPMAAEEFLRVHGERMSVLSEQNAQEPAVC